MMARRLRIRGVVQGVGYRASLAALAGALGLSGWVRNRRDGSVEALLEGDDAGLDRLTDWARRGPPGAQVNEVAAETEAADYSMLANEKSDEAIRSGRFEIRPTV